jgi:hypothetical protein
LEQKHNVSLESQGPTALLRPAVADILNSLEPGVESATVTRWLEDHEDEQQMDSDMELDDMIDVLSRAHGVSVKDPSRAMVQGLFNTFTDVKVAKQWLRDNPHKQTETSTSTQSRRRDRSDSEDDSRRTKKRRKNKKTKRKKNKRSRSVSDSSSDSSSSSDDDSTPTFTGTSLYSSLPSSAVKAIKAKKYVPFQYATSYAVGNSSKKLIMPSSKNELTQAVRTIADAYATEHPDEASETRKYVEDLYLASKVLTVQGLYLFDFWARSFFANERCVWHPMPAGLTLRLTVLFTVHQIKNVGEALCFTCGDPTHRVNSCPLHKRLYKQVGTEKKTLASRRTLRENGTIEVTKRKEDNVKRCYDYIHGKCKRGDRCRYSH